MTPQDVFVIPADYQRVLCPWQTRTELRIQTAFLNRMFAKMDETTRREILRLDAPERVWTR